MNKEMLFKKLDQLVMAWNEHRSSQVALREMYDLLNNYETSDDTDLLVKFALVNAQINPELARMFFLKALMHSPSVKILVAYIYFLQYRSYETSEAQAAFYRVHETLGNVVDGEDQALLLYVQSFYYERCHNYESYEKVLKEAVDRGPKYVLPLADLGTFYKAKGMKDLGNSLLHQALSNVKRVYTYDNFIPLLDLDFFIERHVMGISLNAMDYATIKDIVLDGRAL